MVVEVKYKKYSHTTISNFWLLLLLVPNLTFMSHRVFTVRKFQEQFSKIIVLYHKSKCVPTSEELRRQNLWTNV